jgi:hypothetical protein
MAHGLRCAGEIGPHAVARLPATHGRSRPNPAVLTACSAGATSWAWSPCGARARGDAVARRPRACQRLACRGGEGEGTRVVGGVHRARWEMARLTEEVGRWWGGGERPARRRSDGGGRLDGG